MKIRLFFSLLFFHSITPIFTQTNLDVQGNAYFFGRIGIGTSSPQYPVHILKDTISINGLEIANLSNANLGLDGDIVPYGGSGLAYDLGNNNPTEHWDDVVASEFITYSDKRVKKNIHKMTAGLSEILALNPVQFQYQGIITPNDRQRFGLIAQEVEEILPNLIIDEDVDVDPDTGKIIRTKADLKCISYSDLIPVLIQAIQEQNKRIDELVDRINQLESK